MSWEQDLQARARQQQRRLNRRRRDPRYRRVLGRLVAAGLLVTNEDVEPYRGRITVGDALWSAAAEPRILELLPAALIKRPSYFSDPENLPPDLREVVRALRRGQTPAAWRGIDGQALRRWLPLVGHKGKLPSRLKTFRLTPREVALLARLASELGLSQTAVVRRGLRALAAERLG